MTLTGKEEDEVKGILFGDQQKVLGGSHKHFGKGSPEAVRMKGLSE